ncbi:hypothetical protein ACJMK2_043616 [Sinanodonta woodiana]|uniref:Armadillo repeat-containing protein 6 n=1 Tax=Sinanodonta woodiana TaxID=1069815 RepID=A0ABD3VXH7_SINWO
MAKQITQQTFDDVVLENIKEFEMSVEDAIEDAVQQFEAQGIDLSLIVCDPGLYGGDEGIAVHPVVRAIDNLSEAVDSGQFDPADKFLQIIQAECDVDLARRCLAGKHNAYPVLIKALRSFKSNTSRLTGTLSALCSLSNGQPDVLDGDGVSLLIQLLKECKDEDVIELTVRLIRLTCIKHEQNRQSYVKAGLVQALIETLDNHKKSAKIVKEVSFALRVLTFDDDVRVPFGQAHENAKMIVLEGNALKALLEICKEYTEDKGIQGELFTTLGKLVVRDEFCKEVMDLGGLELILKSFQQNVKDKSIVRQALFVLKALAGNDDIKDAIVKAGGMELILFALMQHHSHSSVAEIGCATVAMLTLRKPDHCVRVMENSGHEVIMQAMKIHIDKEGVLKQGCMALRNIVARAPEYCAPILESGAEAIIKQARKYKSCDDEAKAALRDLGCHVDFKELWTGEKGSLAQ